MFTDAGIVSDVQRLTSQDFASKYKHPFLGVTVTMTAVAPDADDAYRTIAPGFEASGPEPPVYALARVIKRPEANGFSFISIGRAGNNDVVVPHASVSKCHALLAEGATGYTVADARSKNGTQLNGKALAVNSPVPIKAGDSLTFSPRVSLMFLDATMAHLWFSNFGFS